MQEFFRFVMSPEGLIASFITLYLCTIVYLFSNKTRDNGKITEPTALEIFGGIAMIVVALIILWLWWKKS